MNNALNFLTQGNASTMDVDPCEGDNYEDPGPCQNLHQDASDAAEDVVASIAAATLVCAAIAVTGPVGVIACAVALGTVAYLEKRSERKAQAWTDCVSQYHTSCGCGGEDSLGPVTGARHMLGAPGAPGNIGRMDACSDFTPDDDSGDDSGDVGGGTDDGTETCYWWVEWDENGNIVEADLLYCEEDAE
jgi:hypothetical protein